MKLTEQGREKAWQVEFTPRPHEMLLLVYPDGERRLFSVRKYLQKRNFHKGFYKKLYDKEFFNAVRSVQGMPDWGNGLFNISPEILLIESEPLKNYSVAYLHDHKILIEFNGHQPLLLDMEDKFDSPAAKKWEPLSKFCDIHFDENFIWWGDKESSDSMIIHASTAYKISVSCEGQFSCITSEPDWLISEFLWAMHELFNSILKIADTASIKQEDIIKNDKEMSKSIVLRLKKIKSIYRKSKKFIKPAHRKLDKILSLIENGKLVYRYLFEFHKDYIQKFIFKTEKRIYDTVRLLRHTSPYKEAYELMSKIDTEIIKLIRRFNNIIYTYNKLHNTDISALQHTIYSIKRDINHNLVPDYLETKIAGLVWDDWLSDISEKGECTRFLCKIIIGDSETESAVSFYFMFETDSRRLVSINSEEEYFQFKALFAYVHNDHNWFIKYFVSSELEHVKKIVHDNDGKTINILEMEKYIRGNPLRYL